MRTPYDLIEKRKTVSKIDDEGKKHAQTRHRMIEKQSG